jgi:uncharacterized membrane-anchored protein YhcB (DUF1043 family)
MLVFACVVFVVSLFGGCNFNLCDLLMQALSLSEVAGRIIAEDEGGAMLRRRVAELEEENAQLKASKAEMQKTVDSSSEVVTMLRRELDKEIQIYELLNNGNDSLLEERNNAQYRVANLESEEMAAVKEKCC